VHEIPSHTTAAESPHQTHGTTAIWSLLEGKYFLKSLYSKRLLLDDNIPNVEFIVKQGIGVTLEDAIEFWKRELVQKYGEDGWRKKGYEYNILHSYGQLGKRANYTPYACQKIISSQVLPGDDHGCPFRHRDGATLGVLLREAGLDDQQCREVIALAREEKYMDACKRYFEYTHPGAQDDFIMNHPNKYFEQSMRYYRGLGGAAKSGQNSTE